jgi:hypothetical protein
MQITTNLVLHVFLCACVMNSHTFIANLQRKVNNQHMKISFSNIFENFCYIYNMIFCHVQPVLLQEMR